MSKHKYSISVIICLCISVLWIAGCGNNQAENIEQAISYAIRVFERYSGSQAVSEKGRIDLALASLPKTKESGKINAIQQKLNKLTDEQQKEFDEALRQLEQFINQASTNPAKANTLAIAKALAAQFHLYNGYWLIDDIQSAQISQIQLQTKIHSLCMQINSLKAEKDMLKPATYQTVISKTKFAIKAMQKEKAITQTQLKHVRQALDILERKLEAALKERDIFNTKIGQLSRKMDKADAEQALALQKTINELENKRFEILAKIQKLRTGPYTLDRPIDISFLSEHQTLKTIGGIEQLKQEQKRLQIRIDKIEEAIKLQQEYLRNINSQMKIAMNKSALIAKQLDKLTNQLKSQLDILAEAADNRNNLSKKANNELSQAIKLSKAAQSDANKYISAIKQAASSISSSGRTDNFLEEASKSKNLIFGIDNVLVDAMLLKARILSEDVSYINAIINVLKYPENLVAIPKKLEEIKKQANTQIANLTKTKINLIEQALKISQSNAKTVRGDISPVIKTQFAIALYQASLILPERSSEYLEKAKSVLTEILSNKGIADETLLEPAKILSEQLGA